MSSTVRLVPTRRPSGTLDHDSMLALIPRSQRRPGWPAGEGVRALEVSREDEVAPLRRTPAPRSAPVGRTRRARWRILRYPTDSRGLRMDDGETNDETKAAVTGALARGVRESWEVVSVGLAPLRKRAGLTPCPGALPRGADCGGASGVLRHPRLRLSGAGGTIPAQVRKATYRDREPTCTARRGDRFDETRGKARSHYH